MSDGEDLNYRSDGLLSNMVRYGWNLKICTGINRQDSFNLFRGINLKKNAQSVAVSEK